MNFWFFAGLVIAYLLGAIPTSVIVGKILGVDVRQQGSRNPGATNLARLSGRRSWGAFVLIIDALKGFLPAQFGFAVLSYFAVLPSGADEWTARVLLGSAAILGHAASIYLAFRGGKGVATSLGVVLALAPWIGLACFIIWGISAEITRRISVSSLLAGMAFPLFLQLRADESPPVAIFSWVLPIFLLFTHRHNLINLIRGTEPCIPRERLVRHFLKPRRITEEGTKHSE